MPTRAIQKTAINSSKEESITCQGASKSLHGTSKRDVERLPLQLWVANSGKEVKARKFFDSTKQLCFIRNVCSRFRNLFDGVKHMLEYRMRLVYAHFPINDNITNGGKILEIRNYLGEKIMQLLTYSLVSIWRKRLEVPYLEPESIAERTR